MKAYFWALVLIITNISCKEQNDQSEETACGSTITARIRSIQGSVDYSTKVNRFYIKWGSDTLSNQPIAVPCNLPSEFQSVGKIITFDGNFALVGSKQLDIADAFRDRQQVYQVYISKIY